MSDSHPYEVRQSNLTGRHRVHYKCPHCGAELHNPLEQAGSEDVCPECSNAFTVPGADAREWIRQRETEAERERQAQREAAEQERARRSAERRTAARDRLEQTQTGARRARERRDNPLPDRPCFPRYWAPRVVRVLWWFAVCGAILTLVIGAFDALINDDMPAEQRLKGLLVLAGATALSLVWTRIVLELVGVLFDILRELRRSNQLTGAMIERRGSDSNA